MPKWDYATLEVFYALAPKGIAASKDGHAWMVSVGGVTKSAHAWRTELGEAGWEMVGAVQAGEHRGPAGNREYVFVPHFEYFKRQRT